MYQNVFIRLQRSKISGNILMMYLLSVSLIQVRAAKMAAIMGLKWRPNQACSTRAVGLVVSTFVDVNSFDLGGAFRFAKNKIPFTVVG